MFRHEEYIENVFGINVRPRKKEQKLEKDLFNNPIIHRQINGEETYVVFDPDRFWN